MARFEHLEIEPDPEDNEPAPSRRTADVDEQQCLQHADQARRHGQFENALRFYSRALEFDKTIILAWVGQVQMLIQLDEAHEAEVWARKALELFPGNGELLAGQTQAFCRKGDLRKAGAASDGAMSAQGKSAYRWMARGEWMLASDQRLDEHCFDKARQLDRDWLVPVESALIYLHYDFATRAVSRARQATALVPDQHYAWYVQGLAERQAGMERSAYQSLSHCLQLCPRHHDAQTQLAAIRADRWSPLKWIRTYLFRK